MKMNKIFLNIRIIRYLKIFEGQYNLSHNKYNIRYNFFILVIVFFKWYKSLFSTKSVFDKKIPWIVFFSMPFLKKVIKKSSIIFEYGTGGSTLFFAKRGNKIISVEHDNLWFNKLNDYLNNKRYSNIELNYLSPSKTTDLIDSDPSNPDLYVSSSPIFNGYSFLEYASFIDTFPNEYFDFILIDGRARPSCLKHSVSKVKKGGYIILDDADREYYLSNTKHLIQDFSKIDFPGPVYGLPDFYRTLFLRRN